MPDDVFAPPGSDAPAPALTGEPLFSATQISVATFLGSVFAGATLAVLNARRLGRPVGPALAWSAGLIAVIGLAAMVLPHAVPPVVYTLAGMFGMRGIADQLFVADYATRPVAGWGLTLGVAVGWLVVVVAVLVAAVATVLVLAG